VGKNKKKMNKGKKQNARVRAGVDRDDLNILGGHDPSEKEIVTSTAKAGGVKKK